MTLRLSTPCKAALFSLCFAIATADAHASTVEIDIFQGKTVIVTAADGQQREDVVPAEMVVPGETVVYRYIVNNTGEGPADGVVVNTAIDPNMRYVDGSATAINVEFSVDGGGLYGQQNELTVLDTDGTFRDATPDDITNIRWRLQNSVMPNRPFAVGFKAVLK